MKQVFGIFTILLAIATLPVFPAAAAQEQAAGSVIKLSSDAQASHEIAVAPVVRKQVADEIAATATVEPDADNIAYVTPRIRARVVKIIVEPGQRVNPGDPLAVLNSIELGQAKSNYLKAKSLEDIAVKHVEREQRLFADKISAEKDVLDAQANQAAALAELRSAREALRALLPQSQIDSLRWSEKGAPLSDFTLTAPIAGTVVKRNLTLGSEVSPDAQVVTIINLDNVWVDVNVFEHDLAGLRLGAKAVISVDAYPDDRFAGVVSYIGDTVEKSTRTVPARIDVSNLAHLLKPGMFATATIEGTSGSRKVLTAPASSVFDVDGRKSVFVQVAPGSYQVRYVVLGERGQNDIEIVSGVNEGEQVVMRGGLVLKSMLMNASND